MAKRQDFHHVPGAGTTSKHLKWVLGCTAAHRSGAFMARRWRYLWEGGVRLSEDAGLGPPRQLCNEWADRCQHHPSSGQAEAD